MNNPFTVVFTIDQKFLQHFAVTIVSVLENNRDIDFNIYVIHDIVDTSLLDQVVKSVKETYNVSLNLIFLDNNLFDNYRITSQYSKAVYYRLLFTKILPCTIDKMLFLDSDLVVTGSIKELSQYKFRDGQFLLAVDDAEVSDHITRLNEMGFPVKKYFNAGVLLINLKAWRETNVSEKFIDLAQKYMDQLEWWDQDILNMYFYDNWDYMKSTYNAIHLRKKQPQLPIIIHFAGPAKPWLYVHDHPYKSLYWKYIKLTPFKSAVYADYNLKELVRKYYIKILNFFHLREPAVSKEL